MICLLVETTTTIKISGRLYIHHLFLKRPLNARNNTRDNNAPKLIMAVILCAWENTFWTKNCNFCNAVSGSSTCCNAVRPNMGINCSLSNFEPSVSILQEFDSHHDDDRNGGDEAPQQRSTQNDINETQAEEPKNEREEPSL